jgi:glucosamine--fructose-6-phosphate aminotransferase (isomerizing)
LPGDAGGATGSYRRAVDVAEASAAVDAAVWALVEDGDAGLLSSEATEVFWLPAVDELWSPLIYAIPLQLFTYYLALARGAQPDLFQQDNPKQAAAKTHYDL